MTLNDLEPLKERFLAIFCNFWLQRTFQEWIATKRLEINPDNLRRKFSALNADFSRLSPLPLDLKKFAQAGIKKGYPPKKWLFCRY